MDNGNNLPKREALPFTHEPVTQQEIDATIAKLPNFTVSERSMALTPNTYVGAMFHDMGRITWREMYVLHRALQRYNQHIARTEAGL